MNAEELAQIEAMCEALYVGTSNDARNEAQIQLNRLQSSAEFIPQCQSILDNSSSMYAQVVASHSLESLITNYWNNFTLEQKLSIR